MCPSVLAILADNAFGKAKLICAATVEESHRLKIRDPGGVLVINCNGRLIEGIRGKAVVGAVR